MKLHSLEPQAWSRIVPYLDHVLDLRPDERETWLTELTPTQPDIVGALRTMLAALAAADAEGFMEGSALAWINLTPTDQDQKS
jgi:hypothetical protein